MKDIIIEKSAETVEEAIELALEELDVNRDNVEIEVLEKEKKGTFFNAKKEAKVKITVHDYSQEIAADFLEELLEKMDIKGDLKISEDASERIHVNIVSDQSGLLIGRRGETLDAIQFLTSVIVNRNNAIYKKLTLDTEGYRGKRENTLIDLAKRLASKVEELGDDVFLEPMNPYERRIIHASLQENEKVKTYSIDEEPYRKVVITLAT